MEWRREREKKAEMEREMESIETQEMVSREGERLTNTSNKSLIIILLEL